MHRGLHLVGISLDELVEQGATEGERRVMGFERSDAAEVPGQQVAAAHRCIVDGGLLVVVDASHSGVAEEHLGQPARREEVLGSQRPADEHVVIEVDEVLARVRRCGAVRPRWHAN